MAKGADEQLAIYLNDHLAGSVVAIGLLETLESLYVETELAQIARALRSDIEDDRDTLQSLIVQVAGAESTPRKAAGWVAERLTQFKLRVDGDERGPLRLLESAEVISLGIEGKRGLWQVLAACSDLLPALSALEYAGLIARAEAQRERIETVRIGAARAAFGLE